MVETYGIPLVIVAGMEETTRAIGKENGLLWHVPEDMRRFKQLTLGHPVIMGRKTFESIVEILGKPLPGRINIVLTRQADYTYPAENVIAVTSLEAALKEAAAEAPREIHIGGGEELYTQVLPYVSRLHLTLFDDPNVVGDTFFPYYTDLFTVVAEESHTTADGLTYTWVDLVAQ